jgi:dipeptidyl aminopeptidase/acylaminoacyl peptidase
MTFVGDVALSPHGEFVAFTVTTVVEDENRRHREVWLQALDGGTPSGDPFRFTSPEEESSGPTWSPDGTLLSFQSPRGSTDNATWFARVGAPGGEAFQVEGVEGGPIWSPDGRWIAYTKGVDGEHAEEGRVLRIAPDAITRTLDSQRMDGHVITHIRYKQDGARGLQPHPSTLAKDQLFVVSAEGGEPTRLTNFAYDVGDVAWSPDGERLFFSLDEGQYEPDVTATRDLFAVSRSGGEPRRITTNPGNESRPAPSPDGQRLAYLSQREYGGEVDVTIAELAPDGSLRASRSLTPDWDLGPGSPWWTAAGDAIRFQASIGGDVHLFEVPAGSGAVRQVTQGERQVSGVSASLDGRIMAYTVTDAVTPAEVFIAGSDGSTERRLTSFNDASLADVVRVRPERLSWQVADGTEIEGWVVKPVGYQPGRKYPMVLKIHGGPHGAYGNTYFQTFHVLSNAGFFVLYSNPRGSDGYGHAFAYATRGEWHVTDEEDFLNGVDAALARYPDIDPARVGVSGGSYGGVSTNWLTARSDRFAAAVTSRSISNWYSWWGTSDIPNMTEFEFFGMPWEEPDRYTRLSPITYVADVTAPTLIIQSEEDWRTPMADAEQWFMALQKLNVPVEFVRYPRSSHGLSRTGEPWLLVDRLERLRSWFVHWLVDAPSATEAGGS